MNNHDFFCECSDCCARYDNSSTVMTNTLVADPARPSIRQAGVKVASVRTRYMEPGQAVGRGKVRKPSEPQLKFLKKLLAERDLTKLMLPRGVDRARLEDPESISLRGCSDLISNLLDCPKKQDAKAVRMATEGQIKFLHLLVNQKYNEGTRNALGDFFTGINFDDASKMINHMKTLPDVKPDLEEGVYRYEGGAARVVCSDAGRMYAGLWNAETQDWEFTSGLVTKIKAEDRMTLAEMAAFGQAFGRCGHCNRKLTKKESREAGIGPVCATMY